MKAKFKLSQLAAKPITVELKHPKFGDTGIEVTLVGPMSTQFRTALDKFRALDTVTDADQLELFVSTIVGWDEEAFERPFSKEAALEVFGQPENEWMTNQLTEVAKEALNFF